MPFEKTLKKAGRFLAACLIAAVGGALVSVTWANFSRVAALEKSQADLAARMGTIEAALEGARSGPPGVPLPVPADPVDILGAQLRGDEQASVVLIDYSDFQCPYCGQFAQDVLPGIERDFVDNGRVLLAFSHLPLASIHPRAMAAAEAAECAGDQDRFWQMHDALFADQRDLAENDFVARARVLHLSVDRFRSCLHGSAAPLHVRQQASAARALGLNSTPTLLLGTALGAHKVKVTDRISGVPVGEDLRGRLERLLERR